MLDTLVRIGDAVLGWTLHLPAPLPVLVPAAGSAVVMVLIRRAVTNQEHLGRCAADRRRLKQLAREAKRRKDKPAVRRHKATRTLVQLKLLRAEGLPLLLAIPVIAFLATWAYDRLEFHPPDEGETVALELSLPPSAAGSLATLVPQDGIAADRWIRRVEPGRGEPAHGVARWSLRGAARGEPYTLRMRHRRRTYEHPLRVGGRVYAAPVRQHDPQFLLPQSAVRLRPRKVLGVLPWFSPTTATAAVFPAWLVTYVLVVVPLVWALKAGFRIH